MHFLFVKHALAWPRSSGHDVHCFHMMKSAAALGADVSLLTAAPIDPRATAGLRLMTAAVLRHGDTAAVARGKRRPTYLQKRYLSYFGVDPGSVADVGRTASELDCDAVIAVGLEVLPYLLDVQTATRVWYAADEWVLHHLSQLRLSSPSSWHHVRDAMIKGVYERAFRSVVDRVWVVSESERRAALWLAGMRVADVMPNGVDADDFIPVPANEQPESAVFWGRLDFGPNVDAMQWFVRRIWPAVRQQVPRATLTIAGFQPAAAIRELASHPGISICPDVADLRPLACSRAVVVLPFVSGGGIKNKLLEAAAMARPVVCTRRATHGARAVEEAPLRIADQPDEWVRELTLLWSDDNKRRQLGSRMRAWVMAHHSWQATAQHALNTLAAAPRPERLAGVSH